MRIPGAISIIQNSSWKNRLTTWLTRNQPEHQKVVTLTRKQIYIIPTRAGAILAILLFAMLLTSLNYNNSLSMLFTFTLGALAFNSAWFTHRNLAGLSLKTIEQNHCFTGEEGFFQVLLTNDSRRSRHGLVLRERNDNCLVYDCPAEDSIIMKMPIKPEFRGAYRLRRFAVATRMPVGLFNAWSWQTLDTILWVYPRPEPIFPVPLMNGHDEGEATALADHDGDEFDHIREYMPGDSAQHISWKHVARVDKLLVREFKNASNKSLVLDLNSLEDGHLEKKLSQLCYWVITCENQGQEYGLKLPGVFIQPSHGNQHYHQCLLELAKYQAAD